MDGLATQQENLQGLADQLQEQLQASATAWSEAAPERFFQVQCTRSHRGNLLVLCEHPAQEKPLPLASLFSTLEQAVRSRALEYVIPPCAEAKLYLRSLGQEKPYAYHAFSLSDDANSARSAKSAEAKELADDADRHSEAPDDPDTVDLIGDRAPSTALIPVEPEVSSEPDLDLSSFLHEGAPDSAAPGEEEAADSPSLPWLAAGIVVSLISFIGGMLIATRPCVFGQCEPFQMAQGLSQKSSQTLNQAQSIKDLQLVQRQLVEANRLLQGIPPWSNRFKDAQLLLQVNQRQLMAVEHLVTAEAKAEQARQDGQAVQSVDQWQNVKAQWQEAIAHAGAVSPGNALYPLARKQLETYYSQESAVDQAIAAEKQAQQQLKAAKSAAKVAEARQGIAQSFENWQQAQSTWQTAVNTLYQIPNTTTAAAEARKLLPGYEAKLATVRDRVRQERGARQDYQEALTLAKQAEAFENQQQWSKAVITWRNALSNAKQVKPSTPYYNAAQELIPTYQQALDEAQVSLRGAMVREGARTDLDRLCSGSPKVCTYAVLNDIIRVQFTFAYEQTIKTALSVGEQNARVADTALVHVNTLQASMQDTANKARTAIEVYSADGSTLIWGFNPNN